MVNGRRPKPIGKQRGIEHKLDSFYNKIPKLDCQKKCVECCHDLIACGEAEWKRIIRRSGELSISGGGRCPLLTDAGACSVYDIRPALCRLWYTVESNPCPHGCKPERWLTDKEAESLLGEMYEICGMKRGGPLVQLEQLLTT